HRGVDEVAPRACRLERRAALPVVRGRALEPSRRRRRVALMAEQDSRRRLRGRGERGGAQSVRVPPQLVTGALGGGPIGTLGPRPGYKLQGAPCRGLAVAHLRQEALRGDRRLLRSPAIERQRRLPEAGDGLRLRLLEQLRRLFHTTLPPAQLAEPGERLHRERRAGKLEVPAGRAELGLRVGPAAAPDQHAGVLRAADRRKGSQLPALAELLDAGAPLGRALVVAHSLAREDLPTAHDPDRVELLHLAGGGGGARLVQTPHTAGHVARAHARQSLEGETRELEAAVARGAAQRGGAHPEFAGGRWVVAAK